MPIRKSIETTYSVDKNRDEMLSCCNLALEKGKFKDVSINKTLYTLSAKYRTLTVVGYIEITLLPEGAGTSVKVKSTGNVDNIYAMFASPAKKITEAFKENL
ncbi:MAG: hypothetical protein CMD63_01030 [Gammaproteobacteria bacterium]|nr:hypothetical protein [Gammaproteobacteria bacterium]|tara:strand:- start:518 stop:823 length:306 start_codon:yes stop_codon:yes gene_type:complete